MAENGSNRKVANGLLALSSAAVLAVYGAGYARTRAAADRFAHAAAERRPHVPAARAETSGTERRNSSPERPPIASAAVPPGGRLAVPPANVKSPTPARVTANREEITGEQVAHPVSNPTVPATAATPAPAATLPPADAAPAAASSPSAPASAVSSAAGVSLPVPQDEPAPAADETQAPAAEKADGYRDGTYYGWGYSRHGDIQAAVVVEGGRITVARVAQCLTRYSCRWVDPIPPRILTMQRATYDYVSGATESSDAFQDAVAEALSHAL